MANETDNGKTKGWLFGRGLSAPLVTPPSPNKLQRIYFQFGNPISPQDFQHIEDEEERIRTFRNAAKKAVEDGIVFLQKVQMEDPV